MRNPQGQATVFDGDGEIKVRDTFTCYHCNQVVHVPPRADPANIGGLCYGCFKLICPKCVAEGRCDPIEKKLERWEASYHARRSYGI